MFEKDFYRNAHSSFIHSRQQLDSNINKRMNLRVVISSYNRTVLHNKKKKKPHYRYMKQHE